MAKARGIKADAVSRAEFERVLRILDERAELIANLERTCRTQFERIAQMQAQLDNLERLVAPLRRHG